MTAATAAATFTATTSSATAAAVTADAKVAGSRIAITIATDIRSLEDMVSSFRERARVAAIEVYQRYRGGVDDFARNQLIPA